MTANEFQDIIRPQIERKIENLEVLSEWRAFENMPYQYSPIVDIAIGPFSVRPGRNRTEEYNQLLRQENIEDFFIHLTVSTRSYYTS